jgi:NitT/TauT family transport system permease protein
LLYRVVFPAAALGVMTGLRLGVGRGIIGVVVAEFFGSTQGLGFLLLNDSNEFLATQVLAVVVLLAFIGIVTNSLLLILETRLSPWNRHGSGQR